MDMRPSQSLKRKANNSVDLCEKNPRVVALEAELQELKRELGDEDAQTIVNKHIKLLHAYNEAKDATQILLGRLAVQREVTVKEIHAAYGLSPDD